MTFFRTAATVFLAASALAAQTYQVGSQVGPLALQDLSGKDVSVAAAKGAPTVVLFIATKCPVSNRYNERMAELYRAYAPQEVNFVFINANQTEPAAEVAAHAKEHNFPFSPYKDAGNVVADKFGAQFTPEAFLLDGKGVIRYHGRIDDSQMVDKVQERTLKLAIDALLAGKDPATTETKAFGCTIKRAKKTT